MGHEWPSRPKGRAGWQLPPCRAFKPFPPLLRPFKAESAFKISPAIESQAMSSESPSAESAPSQSRRVAVRALMILVTITVVLASATAIFLFTRPSYAGEWVGPGNVQGSGSPNAVVASLTLEQNLLGSISGSGSICVAKGTKLTRVPVSVDGRLSGSTANLTLHARGAGASVIPATLVVQGSLNEGQLTISAGEPTFLLLTLQHGSASDFNAACNQLIQPASGN